MVLRATAGLRLLPAKKAQALLDEVWGCIEISISWVPLGSRGEIWIGMGQNLNWTLKCLVSTGDMASGKYWTFSTCSHLK